MFQETGTWDLRYINREPSISMKLYVFLLLFICIVTGVKLFRTWRAAPPFRLSRQASNPSYLKMLQASKTQLAQWILCIFLALGIRTSLNLSDVCNLMLGKTAGSGVIPIVLRDYSAELTMSFFVALFAFLVRWHCLTRIERLSD
jgi:hypothetical protein